jgi:hypothetical protein
MTAATLLAQNWRGSILGAVSREAGQPVAGAAVRLVHAETGRERTAAASESGQFQFVLLPPGDYRLEIEHTGFRRHVQDLALLVNQELRVEVALAAGQRTESVVVTAPRGLLRTETASVGAVIDNRQVRGLPLDGRNFLELSLLVPGVAPSAPGSAGSVRGDVAMNINGSREDSNLFLLDGVYNGDPKLNSFGVVAPVDAIREFEVNASTYDASFGRNGGGQINVVLHSGGNQVHGTAYEFFRNASLDARNYFAPAAEGDPRYQRNQFGGSLGGPLKRDRTFLFGDFEGRRVREGITRTTAVPTALERIGDFSRSQVFAIDLFTQSPFPGNLIPSQRQHPVGRAIAALYPLPNRADPRRNFVSSPILRDTGNQFDARLDHAIARSGDLAVRYSFADRDLYEPFGGPIFSSVPGFGNNVPRRAQNLMISETHAFSATFVNELRAAFHRVGSAVYHENTGRSINRQVGLPELSPRTRDHGLSFITVAGFSPLGDEYNNPQESAINSFQVLDHATWARGRSQWKFGFDFRRLQQNAFRDVQSRGLLNFVGFTGSALAEMLQGFPGATAAATLDNPQYLRTSSAALFANQTWRARPGLTLTLGLRWEYNSPPVDRFDRATTYEPSNGSLVPVGTGGVPRAGYFADRNNFAPRFGFAWTPGARATTVLRGGYGFYYDQSALAPGEGLYFNAPYFNFRVFPNFPGLPPVTLSDPFPRNFPLPWPQSALAFQRDLKTPYMQHWNFSIQREAGRGRMIEIGYVGSKGTKLLSARDINQAAPSACPQNLRPNPFFADINRLESRASSNYHSLQSRFEQRLRSGLSVLASHTFAKSIDDASGFFSSAGDPNFPQDSRNVRAERARSNFDVRHRFSLSYSYDLPLGKGRLLGGWQTFGIWSFQTGRPFTVALNQDLDNSNTGRSILGFGNNDRPHVLRDPSLSTRTPERWFDTTAFVVPAFGSFGSSGRNILDGPGLATVHMSLLKNVALAETASLQFRLEAFNLFNRPNFDLPDIYVGAPAFGGISSAQSPRHVQLGLKVLF